MVGPTVQRGRLVRPSDPAAAVASASCCDTSHLPSSVYGVRSITAVYRHVRMQRRWLGPAAAETATSAAHCHTTCGCATRTAAASRSVLDLSCCTRSCAAAHNVDNGAAGQGRQWGLYHIPSIIVTAVLQYGFKGTQMVPTTAHIYNTTFYSLASTSHEMSHMIRFHRIGIRLRRHRYRLGGPEICPCIPHIWAEGILTVAKVRALWRASCPCTVQ